MDFINAPIALNNRKCDICRHENEDFISCSLKGCIKRICKACSKFDRVFGVCCSKHFDGCQVENLRIFKILSKDIQFQISNILRCRNRVDQICEEFRDSVLGLYDDPEGEVSMAAMEWEILGELEPFVEKVIEEGISQSEKSDRVLEVVEFFEENFFLYEPKYDQFKFGDLHIDWMINMGRLLKERDLQEYQIGRSVSNLELKLKRLKELGDCFSEFIFGFSFIQYGRSSGEQDEENIDDQEEGEEDSEEEDGSVDVAQDEGFKREIL